LGKRKIVAFIGSVFAGAGRRELLQEVLSLAATRAVVDVSIGKRYARMPVRTDLNIVYGKQLFSVAQTENAKAGKITAGAASPFASTGAISLISFMMSAHVLTRN